jgi:alginate O-acetyltransferase complex protein AlgI
MAFNSTLFAFLFLPFVVITNLATSARASNAFLLCASVLFYAWGEPKFVFVVLASAILDYAIVREIARAGIARRASFLLAFGVVANIGLLAYCKYFAFFVETLGVLASRLGIPAPEVILPLGISFIVFENYISC